MTSQTVDVDSNEIAEQKEILSTKVRQAISIVLIVALFLSLAGGFVTILNPDTNTFSAATSRMGTQSSSIVWEQTGNGSNL